MHTSVAVTFLAAVLVGCYTADAQLFRPVNNSFCNDTSPSGIPSALPAAYTLACYNASVTPKAAFDAKVQCLTSFFAKNKMCNHGAIPYWGNNSYGCDTYVTPGLYTQACLDAYLAQELTNPNCTQNKALQIYSMTPNSTIPSNCTGPGLCRPYTPGTYSVACYNNSRMIPSNASAPDFSRTASDALAQCARAFRATPGAVSNNCTRAPAGLSIIGYFGCDIALMYTMGSEACLNLYLAQEKTNPNCTLCAAARLANATIPPTPFLKPTTYVCGNTSLYT